MVIQISQKQGQFGKHWLLFRPDLLKILRNLKVQRGAS